MKSTNGEFVQFRRRLYTKIDFGRWVASSRDELAFLLRGAAFQKPISEFDPSFDGQLISHRNGFVRNYDGIAEIMSPSSVFLL